MQREIVNPPVDPTLIPEAAHKFAQRVLREHERAEKNVMKAVEHIVKSGQALLKAYDLCEYGQWEGFFELHFKTNPDDGTHPLSLRTGYKYMQLARQWSTLLLEHPQGFSSQRQAFKALAAIARAQENRQSKAIDGGCAARGASGGKRVRTGPVWRVSGPFVNEALRLVASLDEALEKLVDDGFPLEAEAHQAHAAL